MTKENLGECLYEGSGTSFTHKFEFTHNFDHPCFLRLAISLLLLSLATAFTKIEFLEALVDSNIVGLIILKTLCF